MKKTTLLFVLLFFVQTGFCQSINEVELVVSSTGSTKEQAIENGLRMAIEQSYGAFVSSNTSLVNDELIRDEIVTVSSGNIKRYEEISAVLASEKQWVVSLKVIVSIQRLTDYARSHGAMCEFDGAIIGANVKLEQFYANNELIAINNMFEQLSSINDLFNITIDVPNANSNSVTVRLAFTTTQHFQDVCEMFYNTIASLSLNNRSVENRKALNMWVYKNEILIRRKRKRDDNSHSDDCLVFYTRNRYDGNLTLQERFIGLLETKLNNFRLSCNLCSPVKFDISVGSFTSKYNRLSCEKPHEEYRGYITQCYYSPQGHLNLLSGRFEDWGQQGTPIWSYPIKVNHFQNQIDCDHPCMFKKTIGEIVDVIEWKYEVSLSELESLSKFFIEPVPEIPNTDPQPLKDNPDRPVRIQLPKRIE